MQLHPVLQAVRMLLEQVRGRAGVHMVESLLPMWEEERLRCGGEQQLFG